jgi:sterol desaturase/sphingolipid hydroxylase (fatty acid hydroxylase superfamily)
MEASTSAVGALGKRRELGPRERVFAALAFPLMLVVTVGGSIVVVQGGGDPIVRTAPFIFLAYLFLAIAERVVPWHRSWLHDRGDLRTDVGLFALNSAIGGVAAPVILTTTAAAASGLSGALGAPVWPTHWPLGGQLALALVIGELWEYSFHRAMHEVPWLWRFHATHHGAPRLYWLNSVRFHPIDLWVVGTLKVAPLALLGAGPEMFALVNVFSGVHGAFQHANVPVRIGPLNWIFSMTELHRWHHSRRVDEANHNYGGNLILWDVVFGTRFLPKDREPPEGIGMEALPRFPMGFWKNLAAPFRWKMTVRESA